MGLLAEEGSVIDLLLNLALVASQLIQFILVGLALHVVTDLFVFQHRDVNLGILLDVYLATELILSHLLRALFVQISSFNLALQLLELIGIAAEFLDLATTTLISDLLAGQLASKSFLHTTHVDCALSLG